MQHISLSCLILSFSHCMYIVIILKLHVNMLSGEYLSFRSRLESITVILIDEFFLYNHIIIERA